MANGAPGPGPLAFCTSCARSMIWAMAIMAYKGITTTRENKLLERNLVPLSEGTKILPEDAREYARQIQSLPPADQRLLLPRSILAALHRSRHAARWVRSTDPSGE